MSDAPDWKRSLPDELDEPEDQETSDPPAEQAPLQAAPKPRPKPGKQTEEQLPTPEVDGGSAAAEATSPRDEPPVVVAGPQRKPTESLDSTAPRTMAEKREEEPPAETPEEEPWAVLHSVPPLPEPAEDRYTQMVWELADYVGRGYGVLGLIGYSGAGKTHAMKALTHLLPDFDPRVRESLRKWLAPQPTERYVHTYPYHGCGDAKEDRTVFLDPGGELYYNLRHNDWQVLPESMAVLHALARAQGLFFMIDLKPAHFRSDGQRYEMNEREETTVSETHMAKEEVELVDLTLLFLRALREHHDEVEPVVALCKSAGTVSQALEKYRASKHKLDVPVAVLFTKADQWVENPRKLVEGTHLALPEKPSHVAPFVARHLPVLYAAVANHSTRFHFDFVQSCIPEIRPRLGPEGPFFYPIWELERKPTSVGLLPTLEFLLRNRPREDRLGRLLQRLELTTSQAHRIHRLLHPQLWQEG